MREDENAEGAPRNEGRETPVNCELMSKVDVSTVVTLIQTKQTEYFALWAVYTAVEFAASSYGYGYSVPLGVGLAVLLGVWPSTSGIYALCWDVLLSSIGSKLSSTQPCAKTSRNSSAH
jgi:hypothetical protein